MPNLSNGIYQDLVAAVQGHAIEHGRPPDFILMTQDVYNRLAMDLLRRQSKPADADPMLTKIAGVEIGQLDGHDRVELVTCMLRYKLAKGVVS